ncbi:MAG: hypothetical protein J4O08_09625, partial [Chloroflexi bacterium]|nr:hypothetical protein [Chloroflexota bacterium]
AGAAGAGAAGAGAAGAGAAGAGAAGAGAAGAGAAGAELQATATVSAMTAPRPNSFLFHILDTLYIPIS